MNWSADISPDAMAKSACLTEPNPQTCPSIFTLYGGSLKAIWTRSSPSRRL